MMLSPSSLASKASAPLLGSACAFFAKPEPLACGTARRVAWPSPSDKAPDSYDFPRYQHVENDAENRPPDEPHQTHCLPGRGKWRMLGPVGSSSGHLEQTWSPFFAMMHKPRVKTPTVHPAIIPSASMTTSLIMT